jgi:hypothetical protein
MSLFCSKLCSAAWAWWRTPVIPALGRLRQEDHEFEACLGDIAGPHLKNSPMLATAFWIHF